MDLVTVILFQILYYLRPQEWAGVFSTIHFVQIVMLAGMATLFFRERSLRPGDLFRTPHDWAVFAFWLWIVIASPHRWEAFKENANLFIFYIVIVQALRSIPRMKVFALCWTLLIVIVATLALASKYGFDPLDSYAITSTSMKGRLILNLSIFDNPNGLGHSVVPAIPMIYYYFVWKRPIASRVLGFALLTIPLYCIYLTFSKGAFLCGAITILATMCFGRPKSVQVFILVVGFLFGNVVLWSLPRMNELDKAKSDQAIQGRVAAFKHGYGLLQTTFKGIGKGEWKKDPFITDYITHIVPTQLPGEAEKHRVVKTVIHYNKAPHSSYVCIGGELGWPGLFFLVAVLYCCLRTTITARTETPDEERIRRIFFVLVISYIVSSWMVDFEYRPTFFMFTAAIAALHRHLLGMLRQPEDEVEPDSEAEPVTPGLPVWHPGHLLPQPALAPQPVLAAASLPDANLLMRHEVELSTGTSAFDTPSAEPRIGWNWNRFGWFDLVAILALTYGVVRFWAYIMYRM